MDNSTLGLVFSILVGLIGIGYFMMQQPGEIKKKSAKGGLKPRGACSRPLAQYARLPWLSAALLTFCVCAAASPRAEDMYTQ